MVCLSLKCKQHEGRNLFFCVLVYQLLQLCQHVTETWYERKDGQGIQSGWRFSQRRFLKGGTQAASGELLKWRMHDRQTSQGKSLSRNLK